MSADILKQIIPSFTKAIRREVNCLTEKRASVKNSWKAENCDSKRRPCKEFIAEREANTNTLYRVEKATGESP